MRLAVFMNRFPGYVSTFFARDMRSLIDAGIEVDVFSIYPLEPALWRYVPEMLDEKALPRSRVHHTSVGEVLRSARPSPVRKFLPFAGDAASIVAASARYGAASVAKSAFASLAAWVYAQRRQVGQYDHVLAYWGNYAATCAYLFQRMTQPDVPFSTFVHARMDLYRHPIYLREKLLYADNIFIVCEYNRQYLREHYAGIFPRIASRIHTHHLGVDLAELPFTPDGRLPRRLLVVTRFDRHKGVHILLHAARVLRDRGVDFELEIIGEGEEGNALRALAGQLRLDDTVTFRGWLPPAEVYAAMRHATILAHSPVELDAMPTVLKEALALGTPVVATHSFGIPEILDGGRCGVLVPPGDAPALADGIAALLDDAPRRRALAEAGRHFAERTFDLTRNGRLLAERLRNTGSRMARAC